jgi:hypothetical protein
MERGGEMNSEMKHNENIYENAKMIRGVVWQGGQASLTKLLGAFFLRSEIEIWSENILSLLFL